MHNHSATLVFQFSQKHSKCAQYNKPFWDDTGYGGLSTINVSLSRINITARSEYTSHTYVTRRRVTNVRVTQ